jgi:hypothetical protein
MSILSEPDAFRRLLVDRTDHLPILVGEADTETGSRLGGRMPACLVSEAPKCPNCGRLLTYLLTLAADLLEPLTGPGRALSVLFCPDLRCRLRSHLPIERPSLVALTHADGPRAATLSPGDSGFPGRALAFGRMEPDPEKFAGRLLPSKRSKLGGRIQTIQEEEYGEASLAASGFRFIFGFDEASYPREFYAFELPLMGGAMWAFARIPRVEPASGTVDPSPPLAFWENT